MTSLARKIESAFEANAARGERSLVSCSGRAVEPALQVANRFKVVRGCSVCSRVAYFVAPHAVLY
jgi:hypothetical protein